MGGNAFNARLPNAAFPRIKPQLYHQLKDQLTVRLRTAYALVAVPHEAPGKEDFGDIDFVVCQPIAGLDLDSLCTALGAQHVINLGKVYNLAVPLQDGNCFCQLDIHVCADPDDWHRTLFFLSYGDLCMILGLMARASSLSFSRHGLKLAKPLPTSPEMTFMLCSSIPRILDFYSLSADRWQQGFTSEADIFSWLSASRLFLPARLLTSEATNTSGLKARDARPMYQRFLIYARQQHEMTGKASVSAPSAADAIDFFGKRDLYNVLLHIAAAKKHIQTVFTGKLVQGWTGISGKPVRYIMDGVKKKLGGEDVLPVVAGVRIDSLKADSIPTMHLTLKIWESAMAELSAAQVQAVVVAVKEELVAAGELQYDRKAVAQKEA